MKLSALLVMLFLVLFTFSARKTDSKIQDTSFARCGSTVTMANRKLKFQESVILEDYHPIDPVPSSKASVKPAPIEHGSPMIPYVPRPTPPDPSGHGGSG